MGLQRLVWENPSAYLAALTPEDTIFFLDRSALAARARQFIEGFPGLVTYAVKANPDRVVIRGLAEAGVAAFDVASPAEIALIRAQVPEAALHYHNPVRSKAEVAAAVAARVTSWSVDSVTEIDKVLAALKGEEAEIAVRFALPVSGAAYHFGSKFGAAPGEAAALLSHVAALGLKPSLTFHPGTQCADASVWATYVEAAAAISREAGVSLHRLNVGGGFPSGRDGGTGDPAAIFAAIRDTALRAFAGAPPPLVCEPGRALVADALAVAVRVKAIRGEDVFLNDGIYGALAEQAQIGMTRRFHAVDAAGHRLTGARRARRVFGPTCDSLDMLPDPVLLPATLAEGDYLVLHSTGAYSAAMATRFNGFGRGRTVEVARLD
jgi:ornithine decarboxylase